MPQEHQDAVGDLRKELDVHPWANAEVDGVLPERQLPVFNEDVEAKIRAGLDDPVRAAFATAGRRGPAKRPSR
ncbi:MAG: hypothetical protein J7601_12405, partial [Chloroflexi bacterium]|nr:hypothetical protein [Chloroflexota bacterium]